jgi:hypothetical protein
MRSAPKAGIGGLVEFVSRPGSQVAASRGSGTRRGGRAAARADRRALLRRDTQMSGSIIVKLVRDSIMVVALTVKRFCLRLCGKAA